MNDAIPCKFCQLIPLIYEYPGRYRFAVCGNRMFTCPGATEAVPVHIWNMRNGEEDADHG